MNPSSRHVVLDDFGHMDLSPQNGGQQLLEDALIKVIRGSSQDYINCVLKVIYTNVHTAGDVVAW